MKKLKYFSGIKPTLEDLEFDQEGKENAILDRQREMFTGGVVTGLQLIEQNGVFTLQLGMGYVNGERVEVTEAQEVEITPDAEPQYLFLKHQHELSHPVEHFVTGETRNIYQSDSFSIEVRDTDEAASDELLIAEVSTSGIRDRRNFIRVAIDDRIHAPNADSGTTADEFYVGVGNPLRPDGLKVLTESPVPKKPLNVRITAIMPDYRVDTQGAQMSMMPDISVNAGRSSGMARVFFAWDYRDIIGESIASDTFRIDNPDYSFIQDQFENYYLTFPSGEEFLITGNQATEDNRTLFTILGNLNGLSAATHPVVIHPGVTEYRFTAIPVAVDHDTTIITNPNLTPPPIVTLPIEVNQRLEGSSRMNGSPVASDCMLRLPLGSFYVFQVRSVRHNAVSPYTVMGAGSFSWMGQQVSYSHPFPVSLPLLEDATISLEAVDDGRGFIASVNGWDDADILEYGWLKSTAEEGESVDFDNQNHHPGVTAGRTVNVLTLEDFLSVIANPAYTSQFLNLSQGLPIVGSRLSPIRNRYLFSVRPLIGGQVVGDTVSAEITLEIDPYVGQASVVRAVQVLTENLDSLNKTVRNLDAIRQAQSSMIEDQLMTLNTAVEAGQQYDQFDQSAHVTLPFPEVADVPLLGRDSTEDGYMVFDLDPDQVEQTFEHELGHQNYIVQVRDADGNIVDAEVDLNDWDVTIRLAEPMAGTVIIVNAELLQT
ncbi:MAG: hypothetical protein P9X24_09870 [Candidatus Hatepunaea meridiana]|nr:hypothetical protein [Candidatus Hatepunaea meridiana]